jgi:hypothetical protein
LPTLGIGAVISSGCSNVAAPKIPFVSEYCLVSIAVSKEPGGCSKRPLRFSYESWIGYEIFPKILTTSSVASFPGKLKEASPDVGCIGLVVSSNLYEL